MRLDIAVAALAASAALVPAGCMVVAHERGALPSASAAPPGVWGAGDEIAARTARLQHWDGLLPVSWDEGQGRLLLEIPSPGAELIYQVGLASGVGSNPIGLDRNQIADTRIVRFDRVGPRVLLVEPNQAFRADGGNPAERRAVADSFASSVLWSFKLEAESGGRLLVDATEFFLRDAHGVGARLREAKQGSYAVEPARCAPYLPRTRAFPGNTEVEAIVTLVTKDLPGPLVSAVAPSPEAITVRQHHSFVRLPPPGYRPRLLDPRVGYLTVDLADYASPFTAPLEQRLILRHRLEKRDPSAALSAPLAPLVYHVDHAVPEPIRSALVEGASWWKEAFEKAGFRDAFEVRILPEDADPLDIRWNVIHWVHRSTRGWSYGASVVDPRTGEILKANVTLGSLRIRQDLAIASALLPPYKGPDPAALALLDPGASPSELALARIRQLAAHEVGHTLGLAHNFAASTYGRASVMDYPPPRIGIRDGRLDLSEAYARGMGAYDLFAIRYGYTQLPPGTDEAGALRSLVAEGLAAGMLFLADEDGRDPGSAHPLGAVWDDGPDPVAGLAHAIEVRRIALSRFGLANLRPGQPLSELEPLLLLVYLHHRYQVEAALKSLGGVSYSHAVREAGGPRAGQAVPGPVRALVPPARQRQALRLALDTLEPGFLEVPRRILELIPPPLATSRPGTAERFERATASTFDPIAAARAAAAITLGALLHPARTARLARFHAEDPGNPSPAEVAGALVDRLVAPAHRESQAAIRRAVREVAAARLMEIAGDRATDPAVRAAAEGALRDLAARLRAAPGRGAEAQARRSSADEIARFLDRPYRPREPAPPVAVPPGPPI